jgi:hypothetical protein
MVRHLKTMVVDEWQQAGCPEWQYEETLRACLKIDEELRRDKENPAKRFREEIDKKNSIYLRQWVMGCHFDWLNPRE